MLPRAVASILAASEGIRNAGSSRSTLGGSTAAHGFVGMRRRLTARFSAARMTVNPYAAEERDSIPASSSTMWSSSSSRSGTEQMAGTT